MEDMDEVRKASGTVADFSGWNVNNRFGKMKLSSSEKVIEPEPEPQQMPEGYINKTQQRKENQHRQEFETPEIVERSREQNPEELRQAQEQMEQQAQVQEEQQKRDIPTYSININSLGEIKELAKTLLPTLEKVKPNEFAIASELAIEYAMTFEGVWGQKIGGSDVGRETDVENVEETDQAADSEDQTRVFHE